MEVSDSIMLGVYKRVGEDLGIGEDEVRRVYEGYMWLIREWLRGSSLAGVVEGYGCLDDRILVLREIGSLVDWYGNRGFQRELGVSRRIKK